MKTSFVISKMVLPNYLLTLLFFAAMFFSGVTGEAQSAVVRSRVNVPVQHRPARQVAVAGQSTVRGRVVFKDNGQPLKGTRVIIFTTDSGPDSERLFALTNDRGEFHLENLATGKYYLTLEGPGIAMQNGFGIKIPLPMSAIPKREDFEEIIPRHDGEFTVDGANTVDVEVRISRGGTISGKVLKADGAPAPDLSVSFISREGTGSGPYTARFSARTDKDGAYRIENIPEGDYIVAAATEDKSATFDMRARLRGESQIVTYHPAAISVREAMIVRVDSGRESAGVNVTLVARKSFAVSGKVVRQSDGTPIADANVLLRNKESESGGALVPGMGQRTTRSDSEGRWSFSNVMEGAYVVSALAPNSRPEHLSIGPVPELRDGAPMDREQAFRESRQRFLVTQDDVDVAGADVSGLLMAISGPGSVVGQVEADHGALPPNLVIFLEVISKATRPGPPLPVRVRPDGSFVFSGIQGGDVYLSAASPPDSKYFVKSMTANGESLQRVSLKIVEGAETGPVRVLISQGAGVLSGRVISDTGEGLSNLVVLLAPAEAEKQRFRTAYLTTRTAPDGRYSVSGAPGEYFLFARRREELPAIVTEEFVRSQAGNAKRVILTSGENARMDVRMQ